VRRTWSVVPERHRFDPRRWGPRVLDVRSSGSERRSRSERLPRSRTRTWSEPPSWAIAGVAAGSLLLTTFSPGPAPPSTPAAVPVTSPATLQTPAPTEGRIAASDTPVPPQLSALLDVDHGDAFGDTGRVGIPELEAARDLTPFRTSSIPGVADDDLATADLVVRAAEDGTFDLDELDDAFASALHVAAGVEFTATGTADGPGEVTEELQVLGADGPQLRPLTPEVTASADPVWERFAEGEALVTHEAAERLGLELGDDLELHVGDGAPVTIRAGAFAANGEPALADVVVPLDVAADLGSTEPDLLIVTATDDVLALADELGDATGGDVDVVNPPAPAVSDERRTEGTPSGDIEGFSYTSRSDGRITIHGDWVERNIVRVPVPGMGTTQCHRVMVPQLYAAIEELIDRGLYDHLDPSQFAGCFVARHIDWRPDRPLSMHAWGLAIDFNARDNPLGATPTMDPRVVEVFERWGFDWGGRWSRPDGMHFELARIVPVD
jgi:hypothetical protein